MPVSAASRFWLVRHLVDRLAGGFRARDPVGGPARSPTAGHGACRDCRFRTTDSRPAARPAPGWRRSTSSRGTARRARCTLQRARAGPRRRRDRTRRRSAPVGDRSGQTSRRSPAAPCPTASASARRFAPRRHLASTPDAAVAAAGLRTPPPSTAAVPAMAARNVRRVGTRRTVGRAAWRHLEPTRWQTSGRGSRRHGHRSARRGARRCDRDTFASSRDTPGGSAQPEPLALDCPSTR